MENIEYTSLYGKALTDYNKFLAEMDEDKKIMSTEAFLNTYSYKYLIYNKILALLEMKYDDYALSDYGETLDVLASIYDDYLDYAIEPDNEIDMAIDDFATEFSEPVR